MINFDNTEHAFAHKSNAELKKAHFLFSSMGNALLTKIGVSFTNFAFAFGLPIKGIIKKTLFQQFCGGETLQEASEAAKKIYEYGVGVILDYGVEGKETETQFEETTAGFIEAIQFAKGKDHIPFVSIKVTGFGRFALLQKMDEGHKLSSDELLEFTKIEHRMIRICEAAIASKTMILVDAEETWVQDPVDELTLKMMKMYNNQKAVIFNTYQMYRHDRLAFLKNNLELALQQQFILGAKLVRGAYMEKERKRAIENNYTSPIQTTKQNSDNDFDTAVTLCIENRNQCNVFVGTHNEKSCNHAVQLMKQFQIDPKSHQVYFSQLYGMSDNISFNLAHATYNVSKYLPYGPVQDVIPYLMRRAQENTSVKGQTGRELMLIKKELKRRRLSSGN